MHCGLRTTASNSNSGNQSWLSFETHSSMSFSQFLKMQRWISNFQLLTASSVRILLKDLVNPSWKNLWQGSLLVSRPLLQRFMEASRSISSSHFGRTGTTQRVLLIISSNLANSLTGKYGSPVAGSNHASSSFSTSLTLGWLEVLESGFPAGGLFWLGVWKLKFYKWK